jgi:ribosomal protein L5
MADEALYLAKIEKTLRRLYGTNLKLSKEMEAIDLYKDMSKRPVSSKVVVDSTMLTIQQNKEEISRLEAEIAEIKGKKKSFLDTVYSVFKCKITSNTLRQD